MRKTLFDIARISAISLLFLLLLSIVPYVQAFSIEKGQTGGKLLPTKGTLKIHQNRCTPNASDFHVVFTVPSGVILGWSVDSGADFPGWNVSADWNSSRIKVDSYSPSPAKNIPFCTWVTIKFTMWSKKPQAIVGVKTNVTWSNSTGTYVSVPDKGVKWPWTVADVGNPGMYLHNLVLANYDPVSNLSIVGLAFLPTMTGYTDLTTIIFPHPYYNFTLDPLGSWSMNATTEGPLVGGHIYLTYNVTTDAGSALQEWIDIFIGPDEVGGLVIPIDKFGLLAPYIGLVSTAMIGAVATVVYVRRVKRRKEKQ